MPGLLHGPPYVLLPAPLTSFSGAVSEQQPPLQLVGIEGTVGHGARCLGQATDGLSSSAEAKMVRWVVLCALPSPGLSLAAML